MRKKDWNSELRQMVAQRIHNRRLELGITRDELGLERAPGIKLETSGRGSVRMIAKHLAALRLPATALFGSDEALGLWRLADAIQQSEFLTEVFQLLPRLTERQREHTLKVCRAAPEAPAIETPPVQPPRPSRGTKKKIKRRLQRMKREAAELLATANRNGGPSLMLKTLEPSADSDPRMRAYRLALIAEFKTLCAKKNIPLTRPAAYQGEPKSPSGSSLGRAYL